jgi:hypothetical protein
MALWQHGPDKNWNALRGLATTAGTFASIYRPGRSGEQVVIMAPGGDLHLVNTPGLGDWFLAAEDGKVAVYYSRIVADGHDLMRVPTTIPCGVTVGSTSSGGVGPVGPPGPAGPQGPPGATGAAGGDGKDVQVSEDHMRQIAALTAEQVWTMPPIEGYRNISGLDFGTLAQEVVAYLLTQRQDLFQLAAHRAGEALVFMHRDNNLPPVPPTGQGG